MKADANAILLNGGVETLRKTLDNGEKYQRIEEWTKHREATKFPLKKFTDIKVDVSRRDYLVKDLLANTGLAVIWGPPKCGKSFWALDLGLHIALGWQYRGRRVQQAPVVYMALEGQQGLPARIEAFRRHHGVKDAPFYLITSRLNLISEARQLVADILAQIPGGTTPGVVFIDTLNRSLVGSESKDEDMARYLAAADIVATLLTCAVVIIHHCGIDTSRPRGHTSLTGSVESQLAVKKGESSEVIVTVEYAKDFPEGTEIISRLERVTVGTDPDGDEIATLVVLPSDRGAMLKKAGKREKPEARSLRTFRQALGEALLKHGDNVDLSDGQGHERRAVEAKHVRAEFYDRYSTGDGDIKKAMDAKQKAFQRILRSLPDNVSIVLKEDREWIWEKSI
jgi:hypothetical protein